MLPYKPVAYRVSALLSPWAHYKAVKDFTFDRGAHDRVQAGAILALTLKEAAAYERRGYVVKTTLANAKEA